MPFNFNQAIDDTLRMAAQWAISNREQASWEKTALIRQATQLRQMEMQERIAGEQLLFQKEQQAFQEGRFKTLSNREATNLGVPNLAGVPVSVVELEAMRRDKLNRMTIEIDGKTIPNVSANVGIPIIYNQSREASVTVGDQTFKVSPEAGLGAKMAREPRDLSYVKGFLSPTTVSNLETQGVDFAAIPSDQVQGILGLALTEAQETRTIAAEARGLDKMLMPIQPWRSPEEGDWGLGYNESEVAEAGANYVANVSVQHSPMRTIAVANADDARVQNYIAQLKAVRKTLTGSEFEKTDKFWIVGGIKNFPAAVKAQDTVNYIDTLLAQLGHTVKVQKEIATPTPTETDTPISYIGQTLTDRDGTTWTIIEKKGRRYTLQNAEGQTKEKGWSWIRIRL